MTYVHFGCPLCARRVKVQSAKRHRAEHHPEIDFAAFALQVKAAKRDGQLKFRKYKSSQVPKGPASATTVLQNARNTKAGVKSIISGGAFGMGKKR